MKKIGRHAISFLNGQTFESQKHLVSKNRNFDGRDWFYFETLSAEVLTVSEAKVYHSWKLADGGVMTAWIVPKILVENIKKLA